MCRKYVNHHRMLIPNILNFNFLYFNLQVSVGNIGEISKIRITHDNTGDFPGWLCDEVCHKRRVVMEIIHSLDRCLFLLPISIHVFFFFFFFFETGIIRIIKI